MTDSKFIHHIFNKLFDPPSSIFESDAGLLSFECRISSELNWQTLADIGEHFETKQKYNEAALYYLVSSRMGNNILMNWIFDTLDIHYAPNEIQGFFWGAKDNDFKIHLNSLANKIILNANSNISSPNIDTPN